jgi:hypothetical protein
LYKTLFFEMKTCLSKKKRKGKNKTKRVAALYGTKMQATDPTPSSFVHTGHHTTPLPSSACPDPPLTLATPAMRASTTDADERPLVELAVVAPTPSTSSPSPATGPAASASGFSRAVRCNARSSGFASASGADGAYPGNAISTTKYTAASFLPKSLFEQFRRVANCFFLVVACVSFSPLAPYRAVSVLLPLVVVVSAAMAKEAVEDWRRKQQVREVALSVETHFFPKKESITPSSASSQLGHWRLLIPWPFLPVNAVGEENVSALDRSRLTLSGQGLLGRCDPHSKY